MTQPNLRMLGGFRLVGRDGQEVPVPGKKAQALLAYLAMNPGQKHSREKLATLLWGDRMDEQARHSLRQALLALRKTLGTVLSGEKIDPLTTDNETAALNAGFLESDVEAFESHAARGTAQDLEAAVAMYAGPLLDGLRADAEGFDDWLAAERDRLHVIACGVLERLAEHQENAGDTDNAIETAKRLLKLDPAREEGHRLLMRMYAASGRRADALRQYKACGDALRRELDAEPSPETTRLYEEIRGGEAPQVEKPPPREVSIDAQLSGAPPPLPDRPSIAVLPFENLSNDPEQEYFSDGLAEDIITDLSKISGLFVVARQSSFTYKGKPVTVQQIGRELGVGHILEGSVRKSGNRVRITVQLVDVEKGHDIWAERYDRTLDDLFAVQDEITDEIVTAMDVKLLMGEQAREWRKTTTNPEAYFLFLQARNEWSRFQGRREFYRSRHLWELSVKKDPKFSRAFAALGGIYVYEVVWGFSDDRQGSRKRSLEYLNQAITLGDTSAYTYSCLALHHLFYDHDHERAIVEAERAVMLNPQSADLAFFLARVQIFAAKPLVALETIRQAMDLTPDPQAWFWTDLGHTNFLLGRFDEALSSLITSIQSAPDFLITRVLLAGVNAALHQDSEREKGIDEVLRIDPGFSLADWSQRELPYSQPADLERVMALLSKAGLPD